MRFLNKNEQLLQKGVFFAALFCVAFFLVFSFIISVDFNDDPLNAQVNLSFQWVYDRYFLWSSRLFIEPFAIVFAKYEVPFRLCNCAMLLLAPYVLYKLLAQHVHPAFNGKLLLSLSCIACMLYPLNEMSSAGWRATFSLYYYPTIFALLAYYLHSKLLDPMQWFVFLFSCLYSCNHELGAVFNFFVYLCVLMWGNRSRAAIVCFCLAVLSLVAVWISPGNAARAVREVNFWFPAYSDFNIAYKLYLGFISTLHYYFFEKSAIFVLFVMALVMNCTNKFKMAVIVGGILVTWQTLARNIPDLAENYYAESNFAFTPLSFAVLLVSFAGLACLLYLFCHLPQAKNNKYILFAILCGGFAGRVAMGLSPTVFVSGERTFIFCDFALLFVSMYLLTDKNSLAKPVQTCALVLGCFLYMVIFPVPPWPYGYLLW